MYSYIHTASRLILNEANSSLKDDKFSSVDDCKLLDFTRKLKIVNFKKRNRDPEKVTKQGEAVCIQ